MPVPVAALLATAIHQTQTAMDSEPNERSVALLARAAAGMPLVFQATADDLVINGTPIAGEAPGAKLLRRALTDHHTTRLTLPPQVTVSQWRAIVALYAAPAGVYQTIDAVRDALRFTVPDAVVSSSLDSSAEGDLRDALFEIAGLRSGPTRDAPEFLNDQHGAQLSELETRLDPLLRAAERARAAQNHEQLAHTLLALVSLEDEYGVDHRTIVARERRRVVPQAELDAMARMIPRPGTPAVIARVLGILGTDGAEALIEALSTAVKPQDRRAYIDALAECRDCDAAIIEALGYDRPDVVRDAIELVGRRRIERAVPVLSQLLRHSQVQVRTAAWHALELIGTRDAIRVLQT